MEYPRLVKFPNRAHQSLCSLVPRLVNRSVLWELRRRKLLHRLRILPESCHFWILLLKPVHLLRSQWFPLSFLEHSENIPFGLLFLSRCCLLLLLWRLSSCSSSLNNRSATIIGLLLSTRSSLFLEINLVLFPQIFNSFGSIGCQKVNDLLLVAPLGYDHWCLLLLVLMVNIHSSLD